MDFLGKDIGNILARFNQVIGGHLQKSLLMAARNSASSCT